MSKPNADDHLDIDAHIEKRFEIIKLVGKGAYGIVWRAIDRKTKQVVALKKVFDGFSNQTDAQRTYREVMFLQRIHHDNCVRLLSVHKAENHTDLYLVFEFVDTDLYATIRSNLLQEIHKKYVTYQLLRCVRFLHKHGMIHRDLKPANILLNSDCHAKLADFGLARSLVQLERDGNPKQVLTDYIATRWYRPPEIVTGSVHYSRGVDMWAVGCIIGEMLTGKPLLPGTSTMNQMERIVAICGQPSHDDVKSLRSSYAEEMFRNMKSIASRPLKTALAMHDRQAVDLMSKLLVFVPEKRISAAEAMCHPYVAQFCSPEELTNDDGPVVDPILLPVPDADRLNIEDYRDALYKEMTKQKRDQRDKKLSKAKQSAANAAADKQQEEAAPGSGKPLTEQRTTTAAASSPNEKKTTSIANRSNTPNPGVSSKSSVPTQQQRENITPAAAGSSSHFGVAMQQQQQQQQQRSNNTPSSSSKPLQQQSSSANTSGGVAGSTGALGALKRTVATQQNRNANTNTSTATVNTSYGSVGSSVNPVSMQNNNNNQQPQQGTNNTNNDLRANAVSTKVIRRRTTPMQQQNNASTNNTSNASLQQNTSSGGALAALRQSASTPAPQSNSAGLLGHPYAGQPLPSTNSANLSTGNAGGVGLRGTSLSHHQYQHQQPNRLSDAIRAGAPPPPGGNSYLGGGAYSFNSTSNNNISRRPLASEAFYGGAGRSTPQPYSTNSSSSMMMAQQQHNNSNSSISTSQQNQPLPRRTEFGHQFAQSKANSLLSNPSSGGGGLQVSVKPMGGGGSAHNNSIYNSNSAMSWNNHHPQQAGGSSSSLSHQQLAPMPGQVATMNTYSKPSLGSMQQQARSTSQQNANTRVTSKLRSMVQNA